MKRDADPFPDRPPVSTSVIVISLINPSSSFQKVCEIPVSVNAANYADFGFPGDSQGSWMHGSHIRTHYRRGRCGAQGELLPATHDTEGKQSSMIFPIQAATTSPSYDGHSIPCHLCSRIATTRQITYEFSFQCRDTHWRSRFMAGQSTSATQVPFFCSGSSSHSEYLIRTAARKGGPSTNNKVITPQNLVETDVAPAAGDPGR